jgi:hypothetical protein
VSLDFVSILAIDSIDSHFMVCPTHAHNAHTTHTTISKWRVKVCNYYDKKNERQTLNQNFWWNAYCTHNTHNNKHVEFFCLKLLGYIETTRMDNANTTHTKRNLEA